MHTGNTHTYIPFRYWSGKDEGLVQNWIGKGDAPFLACEGFAPPVMSGIQVCFFVGRNMTSTKVDNKDLSWLCCSLCIVSIILVLSLHPPCAHDVHLPALCEEHIIPSLVLRGNITLVCKRLFDRRRDDIVFLNRARIL
eukprot:1156290-Pelagomonas_calceolata.AAC.1